MSLIDKLDWLHDKIDRIDHAVLDLLKTHVESQIPSSAEDGEQIMRSLDIANLQLQALQNQIHIISSLSERPSTKNNAGAPAKSPSPAQLVPSFDRLKLTPTPRPRPTPGQDRNMFAPPETSKKATRPSQSFPMSLQKLQGSGTRQPSSLFGTPTKSEYGPGSAFGPETLQRFSMSNIQTTARQSQRDDYTTKSSKHDANADEKYFSASEDSTELNFEPPALSNLTSKSSPRTQSTSKAGSRRRTTQDTGNVIMFSG